MSYTLKVGNFSKKLNSTKRPIFDDWAEYVVHLKTPTDFDNPVLTIEDEFASFATLHYNYAVLFGKWYWITGLRAIRTNVIEISLSLDALATYKDDIKNTDCFIEYGFNSNVDTRISDPRRPVTKNPIMYSAAASMSSHFSGNTYIMEAVGSNNGVNVYAINRATLSLIVRELNTDIQDFIDDIMAGEGTAEEKNAELTAYNLRKSLLNDSAFASIKSVHWMPFPFSSVAGTSTQIWLGNYNTGEYGALQDFGTTYQYDDAITIPWPVGDYRRGNCQMSLYLPFIGTVSIPTEQCMNVDTIAIHTTIDLVGGDLAYTVKAGLYTVYTGTTNIAVPYAVGSSNVGLSKATGASQQAIGAVLSFAGDIIDDGKRLAASFLGKLSGTDSAVGAFLNAAQPAISNYTQTVPPLVTSVGNMGGSAGKGQPLNATLTLIYFPTVSDAEFSNLYGHPVMRIDKPVSGFCKTRGFSISIPEEPGHMAFINSVMDGGCYIEDYEEAQIPSEEVDI